jgi:hypothetical protein
MIHSCRYVVSITCVSPADNSQVCRTLKSKRCAHHSWPGTLEMKHEAEPGGILRFPRNQMCQPFCFANISLSNTIERTRYVRRSPPQLDTRVLTQVSNFTQPPLAALGWYCCTVAGVFSDAPAFLPRTGSDASFDSA